MIESEIATPLDCIYIDAVRPDDIDLPEGMEIRHMCVEGRWRLAVSYTLRDWRDVLTLKNTLDELIRAFQIVEKVILL
ncbi:MAG: KEOPS complex subunit Pcc1 [Pyrobaculum sp.]